MSLSIFLTCRTLSPVVPWISECPVQSSPPRPADHLPPPSHSINEFGTVWKRSSSTPDLLSRDACVDPFLSPLATRDIAAYAHQHAGHFRRQTTADVLLTQGYVTTDAFGSDGDDTAHAALPSYTYPHFFQALGGFPEAEEEGGGGDGVPETVDLIFIDFIASNIIEYLAAVGSNYSEADVLVYVDENFSTNTYLPLFVQMSELFQQNLDNCTIF